MERVVVDSTGAVVISPEMVRNLGLSPGDQMSVIQTTLGWTLYSDKVDRTTLEWWESLSEDERKQAAIEAREYEALSVEEQDAIWNQFDESLDELDEDEEDSAAPTTYLQAQ